MLHTIDSFRSFIDDPYLFAQIAVTHALSDIYAMGGKPVTALAVITVPFATPNVTRNILRQLLSGALFQLKEDGVELVGGHTSEGMELSLGFAINGIVAEQDLLTKSGMQDGDALILTKPLGTGALFAADMQHQARGVWINKALSIMKQSNLQALNIIRANNATGSTDVTGFGLAGHLTEMINASGCGVVLDLESLPIMDGAREIITQLGITSTLHGGNRSAVSSIPDESHGAFELLFDPQTSGGLLVSLPPENARTCVSALNGAGYEAAGIIGSVTSKNKEISFSGKVP
jgi:selenide,water dikinase